MKNKETQKHISYYEILQVSPAASDSDIRAAYYRLAKRFHPDRNPQERRMNELRFRLINEAYAHIKTQDKRMHYNRTLKQNKITIKAVKKQTSNDNRKIAGQNNGWLSRFGMWFFSVNTSRSELK